MKNFILVILAGFTLVASAQVPPPPAASQAEVNAGLAGSKFVSPKTLAGISNLTLGSGGLLIKNEGNFSMGDPMTGGAGSFRMYSGPHSDYHYFNVNELGFQVDGNLLLGDVSSVVLGIYDYDASGYDEIATAGGCISIGGAGLQSTAVKTTSLSASGTANIGTVQAMVLQVTNKLATYTSNKLAVFSMGGTTNGLSWTNTLGCNVSCNLY